MKIFLILFVVLFAGCSEVPAPGVEAEDVFLDKGIEFDIPEEIGAQSVTNNNLLEFRVYDNSINIGELHTVIIDTNKRSVCLDAKQMNVLRNFLEIWRDSENYKYKNYFDEETK